MEYSKSYKYLDHVLKLSLDGGKGKVHIRQLGSRGSSKTKSDQAFCMKAIHLPIHVQCVCAKYTVKKARDFYKELCDYNRTYKIPTCDYNKTERTVRYGDNEIVVLGYKTNKDESVGALGSFRAMNPDLLVCFIDEISEGDEVKERSLVGQAIGAGKLTVYIDASNPGSEFNWFVKECTMNMTFDESIMGNQELGEMFLIKKHKGDVENLICDVEIFHYTNHNINEFLTDEQHQLLRDEWKVDPDLARVVDGGMPGIEEGAIYSYQMPKVRDYKPLVMKNLHFGGMDWINTNNYVCAGYFVGYEHNGIGIQKINMEEVFIYSVDKRYLFNSLHPEMSGEPFQHTDLHMLIAEFYSECYDKHGNAGTNRLDVAIDNSCLEALSSINAVLSKYEYNEKVLIHLGTKKKIRERINIMKNAMGKEIFKINPKLTPVISALESLKGDEKNSSTDPRDRSIQMIIDINDSVDYALAKYASKIIKE